MPDYTIDPDSQTYPRIEVSIIDKILNTKYTHVLMQCPDLDLRDVILLDQIQKHQKIDQKDARYLKAGKLIEGRSSGYLISAKVADWTDQKARYIAHILYLRGLMEKLGRGCVMIRKVCEEYGIRPPVWRADVNMGVTLTFFATEVTTEVTTEVKAVLMALSGDMTRRDLQEKLGLKNAEHFRKHYLITALDGGFVEMTIPDKPQSRLQRYRLTQLGRHELAIDGKGAGSGT